MTAHAPLPSVAVFGLGIIGSRAADHIAKAGHPLRTWSRSPRERSDFEANAATAAGEADVIALYLKDVPAVYSSGWYDPFAASASEYHQLQAAA